MDIYYNLDYSTEELSSKMEEVLKKEEYDYNNQKKLLKRRNNYRK